jgi:hypothetical protein
MNMLTTFILVGMIDSHDEDAVIVCQKDVKDGPETKEND